VFYHCEYNSGNRQIGATTTGQSQTVGGSGTNQQSAQVRDIAKPRSTRALKASDLTGRFEGSYICGQGETRLVLDLQVDALGNLKGVFTFGGTDGTPLGRFAMNGVWSAQNFYLTADHWIQRPEGYQMVNITGYSAQGGGLTGEIVAQGCSGFSVTRR
jgi:hypothetical protein